jgi:hypothetical protein
LGCVCGKLRKSNGKLKIDHYVLANDQALVGETLPETGHRKWKAVQPKHPNHRQPIAPLRTCDTGPSRRAAESGDEFAPSKANAHLALLCLRGKKIARSSL